MLKRPRIVNEELLAVVRTLPCLACSERHPGLAIDSISDGYSQSQPHHVTSRGAGGDDVAENLMPLCMWHHIEIHKIGLSSMSDRYPTIKRWLILAGRL